MKFKLEIQCGNAAFGDDPIDRDAEVARILGQLALALRREELANTKTLRDINGNKVGTAEFVDE